MKNKTNPEEFCINLDYLNKKTKSKPMFMMEIILAYLEQTPQLIDTMKQSLEEKDWSLLQAAAHKIVPSFSIMGIDKFFENKAKKIQDCCLEKQYEEIPDLVLSLEKICAQACNELKNEYKKLQKEL